MLSVRRLDVKLVVSPWRVAWALAMPERRLDWRI